MRIPYKVGITLILVLALGSTLADSMFRLLSMAYDGFFFAAICVVVWFMRGKKE